MVMNPPASAGDTRDSSSIPGSERFPGEGNGNSFQYACLGNPMDRGAWQSTVHGVTKSQTQLTTQLWYVCVFLWVCMYELYGIYNFLILSQLNMLDVLAPYWIVNIVRMVNLSESQLFILKGPVCNPGLYSM